ncbi:uncharacterized protein LOC123551022 isoform X4 [Mercenaria mercenaria]|uniref:uncharacterized protein LOC123551022 isoform X4 n=1 Tax=Mercenaria mercenaria TaxID=6596 RepID=UPI00234EB03F|nr:uncharacterized protein LOC123551022 isoform X4 [Mercenaria mercenaria]XP_053396438.1 uncharacterized protein LOC123551022 isoform X4 [Mercenaria mercenaria]XP_053396439.1 uncharacterized protein LOC123551022 isoform X4 [Mercenaria mercenaria]XP_053396440.1 uncharacterized protein LOC123551022 isoform X4 [Mercenaria mercenaria]
MCVLKWYNFAAVLLFTCISKLVHGKLKEPDYDSGWVLITSANSWAERSKAMRTFKHGFDESPLLVDVQVKAVDGPNKGFIFPGTGHVIRDDDRDYPFGNIAYIYDNTSIMVSAPIQNNDILGYCIYTGFSTYWEGPADQKSYSALVRARAWRAGSMPKPDFTSRGIKLTAASGRREDSYVSVHHGLSAHPSLVISRIRFPQRGNYPNFYADSVGSGSIIYTSYADDDRNGYVVYGFGYSSIRVWVPSRPWGFLFSGADGGAGF